MASDETCVKGVGSEVVDGTSDANLLLTLASGRTAGRSLRGEGTPAGGTFFLNRSLQLGVLGELGLGNDFLALGGAIEGCDLAQSELAELAGSDVQAKGPIADAADLFDVVADLLEHFSELAVAAFDEGDLVPGVIAATDELDLGGSGDDAVATAGADLVETAAVDHDAVADLVEAAGRRDAADLDQVRLFDSGGGLGERVGEVAVVGHQQQSLREVVEAANGVKPGKLAVEAGHLLLGGLSEEIHDGGAVLRVFEGRDVAARLVEHEVAVRLRPAEQLAIDADVVLGGVVASAEGGDSGSVDLDAALEDDLLGLAAGGDTGLREDLLEAVAGGFFGLLGRSLLGHDFIFLTAERLIAVGWIWQARWGQRSAGSIIACLPGSMLANRPIMLLSLLPGALLPDGWRVRGRH